MPVFSTGGAENPQDGKTERRGLTPTDEMLVSTTSKVYVDESEPRYVNFANTSVLRCQRLFHQYIILY